VQKNNNSEFSGSNGLVITAAGHFRNTHCDQSGWHMEAASTAPNGFGSIPIVVAKLGPAKQCWREPLKSALLLPVRGTYLGSALVKNMGFVPLPSPAQPANVE